MSTGAYSPDKALAWPDRIEALRRGEQPYPVHLHFIISDTCDLDCPQCPYRMSDYPSNQMFGERRQDGTYLHNPKRMLERDLIFSILDDCKAMGTQAVEFSVAGDELIPVVQPDGTTRVVPIGAWVDAIFGAENPTGVHQEKSTRGQGFRSYAINDAGEVVCGEIEAVYRHRAIEPLYEVTLEDGRHIRVTGSHSLNAIRDGRIQKVPVTQLRVGERVACATWKAEPLPTNRLPIPPDDWHATKQIVDDVEPSAALFRLLGYYTAEGSQPSNSLLWCFGNGPRDDAYRTDALQCIRTVFKTEGALVPDGSGAPVRVALHSKRAWMFFESLGALGTQQERRVPTLVWNAPDAWKLEYLMGLFAGDGCFRATTDSRGFKRNSLHLKTCNRGLAHEVLMLLQQLGVRASITTGRNKKRKINNRVLPETSYYSVNVYAADGLKRLLPILSVLNAQPMYADSIYSGKGNRKDPERFGGAATALKIKTIRKAEELGRPIVYDITVAGTHRFLTVGGIGASNTGGGEPTIHPNAPEALEYAQKLGLDTALITNGLHMGRMGTAAVKTQWLRISIDAATPETYAIVRPAYSGPDRARTEENKARSAKNFEKVWREVEMVAKLKRALKTDCLIGVGFVVQRENWREMREFTRMAKEAGADNVRISGAFTTAYASYHASYREEAEELERETIHEFSDNTFKVYGRFHEKMDDLQARPDYKDCWYQQFTTYLGGDGNLYRCCVTSYNRQGLIGNVREAGGFKALWDSETKRRRIAGFDARACVTCNFNDRNRSIDAAVRSPDPLPPPQDVVHKSFV